MKSTNSLNPVRLDYATSSSFSNGCGHSLQILLIEDEPRIADFVAQGMHAAGIGVTHVADGVAGLRAVLQCVHDLVVLDVMLPGLNGLALLAQARQQGVVTPVILLSARGDLPDRLKGFENGADDYLPKPFFTEELIARVKALLARRRGEVSQVLSVSGVSLNRVSRLAHWQGTAAVLSQREFSLLEYLMRSPGHIFSRRQMLQQVWGIDFDPQTNVVDVCVQRIRKKLMDVAPVPSDADFPIESVRGVGYRMRSFGSV